MKQSLRGLWERAAVRLCLVVWAFGYLLVDIAATLQGRGGPGLMLLTSLPLLALGAAQSLALGSIFDRLADRKAAWKWAAIALGILFAALVQTAADDLWNRMLALTILPSWQEWALGTDIRRYFIIYILYAWTLALSVALIWSARATDLSRLNEARASAFEAAASRAEAAALRLQLNPHFLFNTLNGIASLVVRGRASEAEEMIGRLADFLRSSLAADPAALIPLDQELETVRAYLHVEAARFGDRMSVSYRIEEEARTVLVPNFLLQPLIENAVKHGVARTRRQTRVEVEAERDGETLILSVTNNEKKRRAEGAGPDTDAPEPRGKPIGLLNTRQRLQKLYGDGARIETWQLAGGYRCEIRLPVAQEEIPQGIAAE